MARTNGQQRFYCIFTKFCNNQFRDGSLGSFVEAFDRFRGNLPLMYNLEFAFMAKEGSKWLSGTSRNRYQVSADLPYKAPSDVPEHLDEGDTTMLEEDYRVLDKMVKLIWQEGGDEYKHDVALKAYGLANDGGGIGHMLGQNSVRFLGLLGLVPHAYCNFGELDTSSGGKSGPAEFIRLYSSTPVETKEDMKTVWEKVWEYLEGPYVVCGRILDQGMCLARRMFRVGNDGLCNHDSRKPEMLFWDRKGDFTSLQNIFRLKSRGTRINSMEFRYHGKWRALTDIIEFWPSGAQPSGPDSKWMEFKSGGKRAPHWLAHKDNTRPGMPQCVFNPIKQT
jgi:hypothetical protein